MLKKVVLEYDPNKNELNIRIHKNSFETAIIFFQDPNPDVEFDEDNSLTEDRYRGTFRYKPLWDTLEEKGIGKIELREKIGLSKATFATFAKGESVTMETIEKICMELDVPVSSVVEVIPDSASNGSDEG